MTIKHLLYTALISTLPMAMVPALSSCHKESNELAHHHHHGEGHDDDHDGDDDDHDGESAHSSNEIILAKQLAEKFGVGVTTVQPTDFTTTITVSGELMPAPSNQSTVTARSAGIVTLSAAATPGANISTGTTIATISGKGMAGGDANESARTALNAAKRELDRLTPLHADGIVSTRDYNAALQAYESAKAACGTATAAGSNAVAGTSGTLTQLLVREGQYVEAGTPIAVIAGSSVLSLRANLPERNAQLLPSITGAKFRTAYDNQVYDIADFNGHRSSTASTSPSTQGYIPVYFTLNNNGTLTPGSFCEIYLTTGNRESVISVPEASLSEQQGQYFVYVKLDEDGYEKRPVTIGASSGDRIEIISGLTAGEEVVTQGTTFVRLAESSGAVPEGHSHSH